LKDQAKEEALLAQMEKEIVDKQKKNLEKERKDEPKDI
tara:strand:+ start:255 stop:368 length:114 start_codon:yes stop_codon:yes gene_type:complete